LRLFGRELVGFAKTLVILVAVLLVSAGLCGLQLAVDGKSSPEIQQLFVLTGALEILAGVVSVLGVVIVLLLWGASTIIRLLRNPTRD
jgi:hypothetical protein